jgi:EAL domain-containing protein (putative c-di-GMP-specific phosphodiesterase class I)/GGDEF domain-containing protein
MSKLEKLKKINFYSITGIVIILSFLLIVPTYYIIYKNYVSEINNIKENFIKNQKMLMKNQVNNLINYINLTRKQIIASEMKESENILNFISKQIQLNKFEISYKRINNLFSLYPHLSAEIVKNGKVVYQKNFDKKNLIYKTKKVKNYIITIGIKKSVIEKLTQEKVIKYIYSVRFGAKNNGYISVAEILNYKGGKNFAKVIALPVNPKMVGKLLSDNKRDAKGKLYRKEYLKIANTTGEGFVSYWFYKYSQKIIRPKLSYIKLYRPWNWLIFTSVFLDDVNNIIHKKDQEFKKEIVHLTVLYTVTVLLILILSIFLSKKENRYFEKIIGEYEKEINEKNDRLLYLNKNLSYEVKKKTDQLIENMFTDTLTKLPNREKLLTDLKNNYIAVINIKDFTEINDFYGLEEGDKLLREFGEFLNQIYPTYKLAADEYAIFAQTPAKLKHISNEIVEKLKKHSFKIKNDYVKLKVNIGIGKTLIEADIALKYAKKRKKTIIVYNKKLPILKEFETNLKWKNIIQTAIENDNVIPYVQPIINNETGEVEKYECLMRLKDGDKIYTPYFFLPVAKKANLYSTLQRIMIEKCFSKFSKLNYKFSINISLSDLKNEAFLKYFFDKLKQYGISDKLIIELLEDEELIKNEELKKLLKIFKEKGIEIALDDFGSGYSNFIYLQDLQTDIIKIDGSLIKNISDRRIYEMIKKIVEIAKIHNLQTVGEFVENEEILKKLKKAGIKYSQGYYFSEPFDMEELK